MKKPTKPEPNAYTLIVKMPEETRRLLESVAASRGLSRSAVVRSLIHEAARKIS